MNSSRPSRCFPARPTLADVGDDLIVLSSSGGGAAIVADALAEDKGALPFASLTPETQQAFRAILPEFGSGPIRSTEPVLF